MGTTTGHLLPPWLAPSMHASSEVLKTFHTALLWQVNVQRPRPTVAIVLTPPTSVPSPAPGALPGGSSARCRGRDLGLGLGLGPLGEKMMPAVVLNVAAALGAALHQARQGKARPCESSPAGGPFHFIS